MTVVFLVLNFEDIFWWIGNRCSRRNWPTKKNPLLHTLLSRWWKNIINSGVTSVGFVFIFGCRQPMSTPDYRIKLVKKIILIIKSGAVIGADVRRCLQYSIVFRFVFYLICMTAKMCNCQWESKAKLAWIWWFCKGYQIRMLLSSKTK